MDDLNGNGLIDMGEAVARDLTVPESLTDLQGTYGFALDASRAPFGGWYAFWYDVADQAGNVLLDVGNLSSPMSMVQVNQDGAPSVGNDASASWSVPSPAWLHPSEVITLSVPLGDANGLQDLARVTVDLDLERNDALVVEWTAEAGCNETHPFLTVLDCRMEGAPAALTPSATKDTFALTCVWIGASIQARRHAPRPSASRTEAANSPPTGSTVALARFK